MAFAQMTFHPINTDTYLANVSQQWFIHHREPTSGIQTQVSLGAHSDMYLFRDGQATRYVWSHIVDKPFGEPSPYQCPEETCWSIRPWTAKVEKVNEGIQSIMLKCKNCGFSQVYHKLEGFKHFRRDWSSENGE